ncbi:peptide/nickel transport system ATP-binding protein [Labedella gwakjiensis]|uniref:ABC transporter ATP-binding protein n=1 Tax=Labedella gwakjiensis TaxID=390269 RepID=A0A2P8H0H7_9MICO|nr:ABC transporter ATP-binding protein [Labedella gwakjiensis]PSL39699.1 peptide/nickel transport system ATP-binding protein [Labedella gwakjiensis]RUQ85915.1 ABC transporter ATP-binding protein [Labedella gwakjiensis]
MSEKAASAVLAIDGLAISFDGGRTDVVRDVSLTVSPGECVAVVGESGSGKSVTARSVLGLAGDGASVTARRLEVAGIDVLTAGENDLRRLRGGAVGLVSQDALVSLDPLRRVGREIGDPLRLHRGRGRAFPRGDQSRDDEVVDLLRRVGVPRPELRARQYPHELSGGLRQRALIASAIAAGPRLLIADEPTTALDMTVQAGILRLLGELRSSGTALLLISHDLGVVSHLADRVIVMRQGAIVDEGTTADILVGGRHPYTSDLVRAVPSSVPRGVALTAASRGEEQPVAAAMPGVVRVLEATGVSKSFGTGADVTAAVADVDVSVSSGETLGIVGESGSGKTTLARLLLALDEPDRGVVLLAGEPWSTIPERRRRARRRVLGSVAQDTSSAFDPRASVFQVLADALPPGPVAERRERIRGLLSDVALDESLLDRSPSTLSGGQRQRVAIARALAAEPRVLVLDEPVSALDATVAAGVLDLLDDLQRRRGLAFIFISHDLGVVQHMSDRVAVMNGGRIVETGPADLVFSTPRHEYTRRLLADVPRLRRPDEG